MTDRHAPIGAMCEIVYLCDQSNGKVFISFSAGVDSKTKLDEYGTHQRDIFHHADFEGGIKALMQKGVESFVVVSYELRYAYGSNSIPPYRLYAEFFGVGVTNKLISWDVDFDFVRSVTKLFKQNEKMLYVGFDQEFVVVYDKDDKNDFIELASSRLEFSRSKKDGGVLIYLKFLEKDGQAHYFDATPEIKDAMISIY